MKVRLKSISATKIKEVDSEAGKVFEIERVRCERVNVFEMSENEAGLNNPLGRDLGKSG